MLTEPGCFRERKRRAEWDQRLVNHKQRREEPGYDSDVEPDTSWNPRNGLFLAASGLLRWRPKPWPHALMRVSLTTYHTSKTISLEVSASIDMATLYSLCHSLDNVDIRHFALMAERAEKLYDLETKVWVVISPKGIAREHGIENGSLLRGIVTAMPDVVQELDAFAVSGNYSDE